MHATRNICSKTIKANLFKEKFRFDCCVSRSIIIRFRPIKYFIYYLYTCSLNEMKLNKL